MPDLGALLAQKDWLEATTICHICYFLFSSFGSGFLYHQGRVLLCDRK